MVTARSGGGSKAYTLSVDADHAGQRLDNFLLSVLKGVPRSRIYRIVRRGEVRINRCRARPEYRLRAGDQVRIPPLRTASPRPTPVGECPVGAVLYEDEDLLVLDKPSGVPVHSGSGVAAGLIESLRARRPQNPGLELVHRLDRETSGCLIVAKNRRALLALHALLRGSEQSVDKRYLALVSGRWYGGPRTLELGLTRNVMRSGERMVEVDRDGRVSLSIVSAARRFADATLVEIQLLTGRTHQARVHLAHIGLPIAGDRKYGDREANRRFRERGLRRVFLHAASLRFPHPVTGATVEVAAPLPVELESVLDALDSDSTTR